MQNEYKISTAGNALRQKAEAQLLKKRSVQSASLTEADTVKLLFELEVHQIELEMQNEELQLAKEIAETASEKFTALYDFAPAGYFTLDADGSICQLNLSGARMLGKDRSGLVNTNFKLFITRDTLLVFHDFLLKVLENNSKQSCEIRLKIQGDPSIFVQIEGVSSDDQQKCLVTAIDITTHKQTEEKLQNSETRYRRLFESAKDGILILDASTGQIVDVNPFLIEMLGYSHEEFLGKELWEIGIFKNIIVSKEAFIELQNNGYIRFEDMPLETKGGKSINVEFVSNVYMVDHIKVIQCNIRDITERIRAKDALSRKQKEFQDYFDSGSVGLSVTAPDRTWITVNQRLCKMLGYTKEELTGLTWIKLSHPDELAENLELFQQSLDNKIDNYELDKRFIRKDGTTVYVTLSVVCQRNDDGTVHHFLASYIDITDRKKTEVELIAAKERAEESDLLKTAFLHNISHEIRIPMNAIMGFSSFLNQPDLVQEKREYFTNIIIQSSKQLLSIITDIVNIANIEAGQEKVLEKEFNLNSTLRLLYEQFIGKAEKQNILLRFKTALTDIEANIRSDEKKLTAILDNLIGNALKFSNQGNINFGFDVKDKNLEFYVNDNGIGIPPEMHNEIFKRFRKVENIDLPHVVGSGLGLSISKAYVELLGGKIWLHSEPGKGSIFYFTIPYKNANPVRISDNQLRTKVPAELGRPKTILIAEDDEFNSFLLKTYLSGTDLNIINAVNGIEAVEMCKLNPQIDLVLMDIKMPQMDGYEATKQIREFRPDLPVIAQTAYATDMDKENAFACGCTDFISKPIDKQLLLSKIQEQLYKIPAGMIL